MLYRVSYPMTSQFQCDINEVQGRRLRVSWTQDWRQNMNKTRTVAKWALYAYIAQAMAGLVFGFVMGLRIALGT